MTVNNAGAALLYNGEFSRQKYVFVAQPQAGRATEKMDEDDGRLNLLI